MDLFAGLMIVAGAVLLGGGIGRAVRSEQGCALEVASALSAVEPCPAKVEPGPCFTGKLLDPVKLKNTASKAAVKPKPKCTKKPKGSARRVEGKP